MDDATRWDLRYADREVPGPAPPEALAAQDDLLAALPTSGRALDIACGAGAQAAWLARRGLTVVALDVSPRAIELAVRAAAAAGWPERVDARVHDLDQGLPRGLGRFDVVLCQRFRDVGLYRPIVEHLAPGGIGIVTVLSSVGREQPSGPYHAPPGELGATIGAGPVEVLHDVESAGTASIVVRRHR